MADDSRIGEKAPALARAVSGDFFQVEARERAPVVVALGENGVPGEPGLRPLEREAFEELSIVVYRDASFLVVVGDGKRIARPLATLLFTHGF